jgi:hypothetical protein
MITPGIGYTYTNSPHGFALVIDQAIPAPLPPLTVYEDVNQSGQGESGSKPSSATTGAFDRINSS